MGLLKAGIGALGGVLADSWRDYFYCESMDSDTLVIKGEKKAGGRSSNKKGTDNIISNGSIINVNDGQLKSELLTALQPAMFKISQNNIYYGAIPAYTMQLADELNELLSSKWRDRRGVEIVEFGVSSVNATEEDEARITEYQRSAAMGRDDNMLRGHMAGATAQAMNTAAANENGAIHIYDNAI